MAAALFACAALVACGSGGGGAPDAGSGTPPPPGAINWGAEQTLATSSGFSAAPVAAFGANGTATVLWGQVGMPLPGGGGPSTVPLIGASESTAGATFGAAQAVEDPTGLTVGGPHGNLTAAPSALGATAVWSHVVQGVTPTTRFRSVVRQAGGFVEEAIYTVQPATQPPGELVFATNAAGARIAAWTELIGAVRVVRVSTRLPAGAGWTPAETLSLGLTNASQPAVALDANGMAIVVWREGDAPGLIASRSYDTTIGLAGVIRQIDLTQAPNDGRNPQVAAAATGDFVVTWEQSNGAGFDLRATRGTAIGGWLTSPIVVEVNAGTVSATRLVAGANGTAFAVWEQSNAVFFSRFSTANGNWLPPAQLGANLTGTSGTPRVTTDGNGNALFVWIETSTSTDLAYALFTAANAGISSGFLLDTGAGGVTDPSVSMAANGAAVATWLQGVVASPNQNVVARVFRP